MTDAELEQLKTDLRRMDEARLPQSDKDAYTDEYLRRHGAPERWASGKEVRFMDPDKSREDFLRQVGTVAGGSAASGLAARAGQLMQTAAEGAGIFAGDIGGKMAVRGPKEALQPESLKESGKIALGGAAMGLGFRAATRLTGRMAGVPRFATEEAGVPTNALPSYQKVGLTPGSSPGPRNVGQLAAGYSTEGALADRARAAVGKLVNKFTPERLRKTQLLRQAGQRGARVSMDPIIDKLIDQEIPNAVTDAAKAHNAAIARTFDELRGLYNRKGGYLSPSEADEMIRRQLDTAAYKASGDPSTTSIGSALHEVRTVAVEELNKSLPREVADLNRRISEKLDKVDMAERLFGSDRMGVENRLRNLYQPGNSDNIESLNFLAKESGDRGLARKNLKTATQREFTEDIRTPSETRGRPIRTIVESGAKQITRAAAPLQPYAGPLAAGQYRDAAEWIGQRGIDAARAFATAMDPRNNP